MEKQKRQIHPNAEAVLRAIYNEYFSDDTADETAQSFNHWKSYGFGREVLKAMNQITGEGVEQRLQEITETKQLIVAELKKQSWEIFEDTTEEDYEDLATKLLTIVQSNGKWVKKEEGEAGEPSPHELTFLVDLLNRKHFFSTEHIKALQSRLKDNGFKIVRAKALFPEEDRFPK